MIASHKHFFREKKSPLMKAGGSLFPCGIIEETNPWWCIAALKSTGVQLNLALG
jgi:hypothetical protein